VNETAPGGDPDAAANPLQRDVEHVEMADTALLPLSADEKTAFVAALKRLAVER
jgi:hypothetical protein